MTPELLVIHALLAVDGTIPVNERAVRAHAATVDYDADADALVATWDDGLQIAASVTAITAVVGDFARAVADSKEVH